MPQENPFRPTLDAERTNQLRMLLTAEAAADTTSIASGYHFAASRRIIGGVTAILVLGVGTFIIMSNTGSPPSRPLMLKTAYAVTIEKTTGGWTTLSIADINADPDAVVAELQAAGIEARKGPIGLKSDAGGTLLPSADQIALDRSSLTILGVGEVGKAGLAGLTVQAPPAGPSPFSDGSTPDKATLHAYMLSIGARFNDDGSISIRNDSDLVVVVLSEN